MTTFSATAVEQIVGCAGFPVVYSGGRATIASLQQAWGRMSSWLGVPSSNISGGPDQYEVDDATYAAYRARFGDGMSRCRLVSGGSGAGLAIAAVAVVGTLYFVSKGKSGGRGLRGFRRRRRRRGGR